MSVFWPKIMGNLAPLLVCNTSEIKAHFCLTVFHQPYASQMHLVTKGRPVVFPFKVILYLFLLLVSKRL